MCLYLNGVRDRRMCYLSPWDRDSIDFLLFVLLESSFASPASILPFLVPSSLIF